MSDINKNEFEEKNDNVFEVNSQNAGSPENQVDSDTTDYVEISSEQVENLPVDGAKDNSNGFESVQNNIPANSGYYNSNQQATTVGTTGNTNANMYYSQNSSNANGSQNYYYQPAGTGNPPIPTQNHKSKAPLIIACIVVASIVIGVIGMTMAGGFIYKSNTDTDTDTDIGTSANSSGGLDVNESPIASSNKGSTDELTTVGVVEKVENSCVGITVTVQNNSNSYGTLGGSTSTGQGSGVLMLEDAAKGITYVVTCAHVIDTANSVFTVTLNDKKQYPATLVGYDSQTDIGVLSIKAVGLQIAEFGESDSLKKGQSVIAIGNPGGSASANSPTQGIVSVIDRPVASSIGYATKCIQHSAQINPGNSGGGLFNMYGQVIGINSSKIASTEYEGMGFAVPTKIMQEVVNDIIATGYVTGRAQLGIQYNKISEYENYNQLVVAGLPKGAVVIASINEGSAFTGTDVQPYDVITAVNGRNLDSVDVLTSALAESKPGETIKMTMARIVNGKINSFEVSVILVEAKS